MTTCCDKPNIATLQDKPDEINRVCLSCKTHWYGHSDSLIQYTRKEWDLKMELPQ